MKQKALTRAAMMVALTIVLALSSQIPLISGFGLFLLPLPMALVGLMSGPGIQSLGILAVVILLSVWMGPLGSLFYLPFAVTSLVLGLGFYYRVSLKWILTGGVFLIGAGAWINMQAVAHFQGIDLNSEATKVRETVIEHFNKQFIESAKEERAKLVEEYEVMRKSLTTGVSELEDKKRELDRATKLEETQIQTRESLELMLKYQAPFLLFFLFVGLVFEVLLLRSITRRMRLMEIPSLGFSTWKCPGGLSWLLLVFLLVSVWSQQSILQEHTATWVISLSFAVQLIYFVFGLSFMTFLMMRYQISVPLRVILYSLSVFYGPVLVFLGIFDSLFNFRKAYFSAPQQTT